MVILNFIRVEWFPVVVSINQIAPNKLNHDKQQAKSHFSNPRVSSTALLSLSLSRLRVNRCLYFLLALLALLARRLAALVLLHTLVNNQHLGWSLGTLHRLGRRLYPR